MTRHKKNILKVILIGIVIVISIISVLLLMNSNYFETNKNRKLEEIEPLSLDDLITLDIDVMDGDEEYLYCLLTFISNDNTNKIKRIEKLENSTSDEFSIYTLDSEGKEKIGIDYKYKIGDTEEKVYRVTTTEGNQVDKKFSNLEIPKVEYGVVTWNEGKASVEISKQGANAQSSRFMIEYQIIETGDYSEEELEEKLSEGMWTRLTPQETSKLLENLEYNTTIYARLNNGKVAGEYEKLEIEDTIPPEEFDIEVADITSSSVTISGSTEDFQSGLKNYTYVIEKVEEGGNEIGKKGTNAKIKGEQSGNIISVNSNNSSNVNISRINNITVNRRKWSNNKSRRSKRLSREKRT